MNDLRFKIERESMCAGVTVLDTSVEQSVEKDFVLPDYCADIFRILKCIVDCTVTSQSINGSKLTFELGVTARVLYCSENDSSVKSIVQKMFFTKTAELPDSCACPSVRITPRCDYVNCRVISPRRLDIRGAVTSHIKVVCEQKQSIVTDAQGCNIQLKKSLVTFPSSRLIADKRITVIEELSLPEDKPPVEQVIRTQCTIEQGEKKIIAGKLITKGDAVVKMLYSCVNTAGENTIEAMRFSIPFSQIIDIEGIDESYDADVEIIASGCEMILPTDEQPKIECELVMLVNCTAVKYRTADVVTDAYSTSFECETKTVGMDLSQQEESISGSCRVSAKAGADDEIVRVYDVWAQADNVSLRNDEQSGDAIVSGNVRFFLLAASSERPVFLEAQQPFEYTVEAQKLGDTGISDVQPCVSVSSCDYIMSPSGVELTAELDICAAANTSKTKPLISDIIVDTQRPKQKDTSCAVKLCRCAQGEDIWDIAKRYSTSVNAIIDENELDEQGSAAQTMLLIPLTD